MTIFDEAKIDCHNHVFDPERFPYPEDNFYQPAGQERGTPAQFMQMLESCVWGTDWPFLRAPERIDYGPLLRLVERLFPDATDRHKLLWETPCKLFGFNRI